MAKKTFYLRMIVFIKKIHSIGKLREQINELITSDKKIKNTI